MQLASRQSLAFQTCVIRQNSCSSGDAIWIIELSAGNYCAISVYSSRDGSYGRAFQGGHVAHVFGAQTRVLHGRGLCGWVQNVPRTSSARTKARQSRASGPSHGKLATAALPVNDCVRGREGHGEGLCTDGEVLDLTALNPVS